MFWPSCLLAARFLRTAGQEKYISRTFIFCVGIIALTSAALAITISILSGFENALHATLQSLQPDIIIRAPTGQTLNVNTIIPALEKLPQIKAVSWYTTEHLLVRSKKSDLITVGLIKGIISDREKSITNIDKIIIQTKDKKSIDVINDHYLLIGTILAHDLQITTGDSIELLLPTDFQTKGNKLVLDRSQATVGGIFKTGLDDVDSSLIIVSMDYFQELFPDTEPTIIGIKLKERFDEQKIVTFLKKKFALPTYSWKELYPALLAALKLEKFVMLLILLVLTILATISTSSSIALLITQKKRDIAILKSLGGSNQFIIFVFLIIGVVISSIGTVIGLCGAFIINILLEKFPLELPDAYLVTHIPVCMQWYTFIGIMTGMIILTLLTTLYACYQIKTITVAKTLRTDF